MLAEIVVGWNEGLVTYAGVWRTGRLHARAGYEAGSLEDVYIPSEKMRKS